MDAYRDYLHGSRGEWSVAKNAYVALRSGWFSTRSAAYLASGKPVVVQDTGWSAHYPTGDGLFALRRRSTTRRRRSPQSSATTAATARRRARVARARAGGSRAGARAAAATTRGCDGRSGSSSPVAIAHAPINGGRLHVGVPAVRARLPAAGLRGPYVEHIDARDCIDGEWQPAPFAASANVAVFRRSSSASACGDSAALLQRDGEGCIGLLAPRRAGVGGRCRPVRQPVGRFHLRDILRAARRRVYVDLDPGFTQIWQAQYGVDMNLPGHDAYAIGGPQPRRARLPRPDARPALADDPPAGRALRVAAAERRSARPTRRSPTGAATRRSSGRDVVRAEVGRVPAPHRAAAPSPCRLEICLAIHPDEPDLPRLRRTAGG